MLIDWIHWLSSERREDLLLVLAPILLLDAVRYSVGALGVWLVDFAQLLYKTVFHPRQREVEYQHCPTVCVIIAGLNEADTLPYTLESLHGTYPRMEIIVVDDGSDDGMASIARDFAQRIPQMTVLRKPRRGGKSSALNFALPFTQAEILVCVDGDSHVSSTGIWEIVQPFADPSVGAVSATVLARNPFAKLITWLQALEYLRNIFVGRMFASRMGILGIISGAFGAYRRSAIQRLHGWDVGPGEDGDLTLRMRKSGYRIVFAPYAQCLTNLPQNWWTLIKQRRRWEWAVVTFECRKHIDLINPRNPNFRLSNFALLLDRWMYNVILMYAFWGYAVWLLLLQPRAQLGYVLLLNYVVYVALDMLQLLLILYYSTNRLRDLAIGLATPLMPLYHVLLKFVSLIAVTEEIFTRRSFRDNFVPIHVRESTWHW